MVGIYEVIGSNFNAIIIHKKNSIKSFNLLILFLMGLKSPVMDTMKSVRTYVCSMYLTRMDTNSRSSKWLKHRSIVHYSKLEHQNFSLTLSSDPNFLRSIFLCILRFSKSESLDKDRGIQILCQ